MGCIQNASHWQNLKSECQCKRKTPNFATWNLTDVWWKFVKVLGTCCFLKIFDPKCVGNFLKNTCYLFFQKFWTCKLFNKPCRAFFFWGKVFCYIYIYLYIYIYITKNFVGFSCENCKFSKTFLFFEHFWT